jgi:multisubunit Na+/H+ antiporter MnhF subunit
MNAWLVIALVLMLGGLLPALVVTARGTLGNRLIGYEFAQLVAVLVLLCLAEGVHRTAYLDVALVLAVLSPAVLVFTRFFTGDD